MSEFKREDRYLVLKRSDIESALDAGTREMLFYYAQQVEAERHSLGKDVLECVVVESDWPIYGDVWKMVESIASNQPTEIEQLRKELEETKDDCKFLAWVSEQHHLGEDAIDRMTELLAKLNQN